jgi:ParB family chromosome partitioning protein
MTENGMQGGAKGGAGVVAEPKRRAALGKGLESLLGPPRVATLHGSAAGVSGQAAAGSSATAEVTGKPLEIEIAKIDRNPYQTRTFFSEVKLQELAASIRAAGVVQPIVVREMPGGRYQLIMGERRWRAAQMAEKTTIPAIVRQVSDEQAMEMTIIENLQREDLNPMEQARAFNRLGHEFNMTQEQIAVRTGKDRATVTNFLRLLKLPKLVQQYIEAGELMLGHGRALLALPTPEAMIATAQFVVAGAMSVRQTELSVQEQLNPEHKERKGQQHPVVKAQDPNVYAAQERLQRRLGLRVRIEDKKGKGRVIIDYSGVDDFDVILSALGGEG